MLVERLDLPAMLPRARSRKDKETETVQFAQTALANAKREGLRLAIRARWIALVVIACVLPIINPNWEVLYYIAILGLRADRLGPGQGRTGRGVACRAGAAVLRSRVADVHFGRTKSLDHRALAGRHAVSSRQLHLFLRAAVGRDAGLLVAHRDHGRDLDLRIVDPRRDMGLVSARPQSRADRADRRCDRQRPPAARPDLAELDRVRRAPAGDRGVHDRGGDAGGCR